MSRWSSYKEQQQLHEGWRRFLNEDTMQIAQEVWGMNGGDSFLGTLVGVAKQVGLQIVEDPDRSKLVLDGPRKHSGLFWMQRQRKPAFPDKTWKNGHGCSPTRREDLPRSIPQPMLACVG